MLVSGQMDRAHNCTLVDVSHRSSIARINHHQTNVQANKIITHNKMASSCDRQSKGTVVFYSVDLLGHINPILEIVRELRTRGYRAVIVTVRPLSMAPKLISMGFELDTCIGGEEESPAKQAAATSASEPAKNEQIIHSIMSPLMEVFRRGLPHSFAATYEIGGSIDGHLDDMIKHHAQIERKLRSLKPDLIVVDHMTGTPCTTYVAPRWARVYSGFPSVLYSSQNDNFVAGVGLNPNQVTPEAKEFEIKTKAALREKVVRFFEQCGAQPWSNKIELAPTSPHLNFYLGPKELGLELCEEIKPLPEIWFRLEHTQSIGDEQEKSRNKFEVPPCLRDKPGKLIYFSLGTMVTSDINLINRLLEILSKSENRFIVSKGQRHEEIKMYPNMWGDKFVDQKAVLQEVDLFITHSGHNSIIEAFYYGVPGLLALPVFADQFDSAQRVQDLGFGIRLNPFTCTERELLESVDRLLKDDTVKQRMRTISARLKSIDYPRIAADKLVDLMSSATSPSSPHTTTTTTTE